MIKVIAIQDNDCHWFVIPKDKKNEFITDMMNEDLTNSGEFDELWGKYRTGGDLNSVQLYAEI